MNIAPASNVTAATFGGLFAVMIVHVCQANNIIIPPDVADSLPFACSILIAHIYDCITGDNVKIGGSKQRAFNAISSSVDALHGQSSPLQQTQGGKP